jgi:hypothetical protein
MIPSNETERTAAINAAAKSLIQSLSPNEGYCPGKIGQEFADALIQAIETDPGLIADGIDSDLGHECVEFIITRTLDRLNYHYNERNKPSA